VFTAAWYSADERRKLTILDFRSNTGIWDPLVRDLSFWGCRENVLDGADLMFIDLEGHGQLEEIDGDNEPAGACITSEYTFDTRQGAVFNPDALTDSEIRCGASASFKGAANACDLMIRYGLGHSARADDVLDCRTAYDGNFLMRIEAAEQVTWKGHIFDNLHPIRVTTPFRVCRTERLVAFVPQCLYG
jgi:hypothetical protein